MFDSTLASICIAVSLLGCATEPTSATSDDLVLQIPRCFGKQDNDAFGKVVVAGDFDGDGDIDLAIAAPYDENAPAGGQGAVYLFRRDGSSYVPWARISSQSLGLQTVIATQFGTSLAVGDFDQDGRDEIAIGRSGPNAAGIFPGEVDIVGLDATGNFGVTQVLTQAGLGTDGPGDRFGQTMATGDFDGDGALDLAVAAPADPEAGTGKVGVVYVFRGSGGALVPWLVRKSSAFGTASGAFGGFGTTLAAGDFDGNGKDDLAVGSPYEGHGVVYILKSGTTPLGAFQLIDGRNWVTDTQTPTFGLQLAAADFDGDHLVDLAVAAPDEKLDGWSSVGGVVLFRGSSTLLMSWTTVAMPFAGAQQGQWIAAGDFNGDGAADLAVGQNAYGSIGDLMVWRGQVGGSPVLGHTYSEVNLTAAAAADLDGNGHAELLVAQTNAPLLVGSTDQTAMPSLDHPIYEQAPGCLPYWGTPPSLSLLAARSTQLTMRASTAQTIDGIHVFRESGGFYVQGTASPFDTTDSGLAPSTTYCYGAYIHVPGSDASSDVTNQCFATTAPAAAPTITVTQTTTSSLTVQITANASGATQIRSQLDSTTLRTDAGSSITRTFTGLSPGTSYCVTAASYQNSDWSANGRACATTGTSGTSLVYLYMQSAIGPVSYVGSWRHTDAHPTQLRAIGLAGPIQFVKAGHGYTNADCTNADHVVTLSMGGTIDATGLTAIFGALPDGAEYDFLACQLTNGAPTSTIEFDLDWAS